MTRSGLKWNASRRFLSGPGSTHWIVLSILVLASRTTRGQVTIDVHARSNLDAAATCESTGLACQVTGVLRDDSGTPLTDQLLYGSISDGATSEVTGSVRIDPCSESSPLRVSRELLDIPIRTDDSGGFCMRVGGTQPRQSLTLRIDFVGNDHNEATSRQLELNQRRAATSLTWLNQRARIVLDSARVVVELKLNAPDALVSNSPVVLAISEPQSKGLDHAPFRVVEKTDSAGVARFELKGQQFGHMGVGLLEALFEGDPTFAPTKASWSIVRVCGVSIRPGSYPRELESGDLAEMSIVAHTECALQPAGTVEFSIRGHVISNAPIEDGKATVSLTTRELDAGPTTIEARFIPLSETWVPDGKAHFDLTVVRQSGRARTLWLGTALALMTWIAVKWGRRNTRAMRRRASQPTEHLSHQSMVCEPPDPGTAGWHGVVLDSHTAQPIAKATIRIERRGYVEQHTEFMTQSSATGHFELPQVEARELAQLVVGAFHYNSARWQMPAPGKLTIRLQTNRRALLQKFVSWVQDSAREGSGRMEPTPSQLAKGDLGAQPAQIKQWAVGIERAAFGPKEPENDDLELLSGPVPRRTDKSSDD
jgi:hypothetical protein